MYIFIQLNGVLRCTEECLTYRTLRGNLAVPGRNPPPSASPTYRRRGKVSPAGAVLAEKALLRDSRVIAVRKHTNRLSQASPIVYISVDRNSTELLCVHLSQIMWSSMV